MTNAISESTGLTTKVSLKALTVREVMEQWNSLYHFFKAQTRIDGVQATETDLVRCKKKLLDGSACLLGLYIEGYLDGVILGTKGLTFSDDGAMVLSSFYADLSKYTEEAVASLISQVAIFAKEQKCGAVIAQTPNKGLADLMSRHGFKTFPMFLEVMEV